MFQRQHWLIQVFFSTREELCRKKEEYKKELNKELESVQALYTMNIYKLNEKIIADIHVAAKKKSAATLETQKIKNYKETYGTKKNNV